MVDVTTIGSATQDVYVFSKKFRVREDPHMVTGRMEFFPFGTKIELDDILFEIGGGATNAAMTLHRQGLKTACVARIGQDAAGEEVRSLLKTNRIQDRLIEDKKKRTAHSVVFLGERGERTILVYRGASRTFQSTDLKPQSMGDTRWLYVTSLAGNTTALKKILQFTEKKKIKVMSNPGKLELERSRSVILPLLRKIDILLLNREEASLLTGRPYHNINGILSDLRKIAPGVSLVTEGRAGAYILLNGSVLRVIIKPVQAVDTTGAGDAFGSGFLAGYIKYKGNVKKATALGTSNARSVVQKIGAKHGLLSGSSSQKIVQPRTIPLPT